MIVACCSELMTEDWLSTLQVKRIIDIRGDTLNSTSRSMRSCCETDRLFTALEVTLTSMTRSAVTFAEEMNDNLVCSANSVVLIAPLMTKRNIMLSSGRTS